MNNNTIQNKEELIISYLRNELSEKERIEVEYWIQSSPENFKTVQDYFHLAVAGSALLSSKRTPPEEALKKINRRIQTKRVRFYVSQIQKIAAILLLPLVLFTGYLLIDSGALSKNRPGHNQISYMETRMAPGMTGSIILPDGTKVWLNSSTYLKYPTAFSGDLREVTIDGEAFFKVEKDKDKKFIVHTPQSSVTVLGTEFNIDAYEDNDFIATTLVNGSIEFSFLNSINKEQAIRLQPKEKILYNKETKEATLSRAFIPKEIGWTKNEIILKETPLMEVLWILSKRFNVEFTIKRASLYEDSFTGTFTNQHIERVLEHFKRSSNISYRIDHQLGDDGEIVRSHVELY